MEISAPVPRRNLANRPVLNKRIDCSRAGPKELQEAVRTERIRALSEFRSEVAAGSFPAAANIASIPEWELAKFRDGLP